LALLPWARPWPVKIEPAAYYRSDHPL